MKRAAARGAAAGVGLMEVLITAVIISGGVLALSRMQGALLAGGASSRQQAEASFIARRVVEDLRSRAWSDATLVASISPYILPSVPGTSAAYAVQYSVQDTGAAGALQYKTVQVSVSWTDAQAQVRTLQTVTNIQPSGAGFSARLVP